jgi:predicted CoA-binding protein
MKEAAVNDYKLFRATDSYRVMAALSARTYATLQTRPKVQAEKYEK